MIDKVEKSKRLSIPHQEQKVVVKVMVVGYNSVGKSSLVGRLVGQPVPAETTLGVEYYDVHIDLKNTAYHFNYFDFSGRDIYCDIRNEFYREANILLMVYDVNYRRTFEELEDWLKESAEFEFSGVRVVVGNKTDSTRVVPEEQVRGWAKEKGCLYAETSAKERRGVDELAELMIKSIK